MIPLAPRKQMKSRYSNKSLTPSAPAMIEPVKVSHVGRKEEPLPNNGWRRYGMERRKQLIEQDIAEGGNRFDLNFQCRIQGYFALSEKIIKKFDEAFAHGKDLEATYVMGHRLCHFLTEALPTHPAYMRRDPVISRLREKSFQSLVRIKKQLDAISLRIDEEELNNFILQDFDPFADDDSSSSGSDAEAECSGIDSRKRSEGIQWESFDGWSFDLPPKMTQSSSFVEDVSLLSMKDTDASGDTEDTFSSENSDEDSDGQEPIYSHGLEFLKQISSEAVKYETDSEADDSWAQELEAELEECASAIQDTSYDPARIALQDLLNNRRRQPSQALQHAKNLLKEYVPEPLDDSKENQSLDFDLSPDTTFEDNEEEDIWIAFDPTARLAGVPNRALERVSL